MKNDFQIRLQNFEKEVSSCSKKEVSPEVKEEIIFVSIERIKRENNLIIAVCTYK